MWLGLSLFYVGAVLCLNGLWMLGRIAELGSHVADVDLFPPSLEDIYTQISRRDAA